VLDQPYTLRASGIKGNACARSGASNPQCPYLQRLEAVERNAARAIATPGMFANVVEGYQRFPIRQRLCPN
jgi:hypothetical protein